MRCHDDIRLNLALSTGQMTWWGGTVLGDVKYVREATDYDHAQRTAAPPRPSYPTLSSTRSPGLTTHHPITYPLQRHASQPDSIQAMADHEDRGDRSSGHREHHHPHAHKHARHHGHGQDSHGRGSHSSSSSSGVHPLLRLADQTENLMRNDSRVGYPSAEPEVEPER